MSDKPILRAQLRAARAAGPRATLDVPGAFRAAIRQAPIVAAYIPIGSEADPAPFVEAARPAGCPIVLPHVVDRATPLRFLLWDEDLPLVAGPFGLLQPQADAPERAPGIILTPLLGFDRKGNRLGQGAGHYDRAFAALPRAWRVGVAYARQEVPRLIADAWDVPLQAIATECEWIVP